MKRISILACALGLAVCGCGGGSTSATGSETTPRPVHTAAPSYLGGARVPAARAEGQRACRGMTPLEAARRFEPAVRRAAVRSRFIRLVTKPTAAIESSPGYPRLVAAFYATTVPASRRAVAAAGCARELAAAGEGGGAPATRSGETASP